MNILNEELKVLLVTDAINIMRYITVNEIFYFPEDLFKGMYAWVCDLLVLVLFL